MPDLRSSHTKPEVFGPLPFGKRLLRGALALGFLALGAAASNGCSADAGDRQVGPLLLAIDATTAPALKQGQTTIYQVQISVPLPLADRPSNLPVKATGYPGNFWFTSSDVQVQLDYVVTNLEDHPVTVELMCDGWNDFIRYTPKVVVTEEGPQADPSTEDRLIYLPAKSRVSGTISFDDFERVARVMAAFSNPKPDAKMNPYHLLERRNDITSDPLAAPYVPTVIDGLRGFDLSLREMDGPNKVLVEANLTVRDHGNHLVPDGQATHNRAPSKLYSPVAPAPPM